MIAVGDAESEVSELVILLQGDANDFGAPVGLGTSCFIHGKRVRVAVLVISGAVAAEGSSAGSGSKLVWRTTRRLRSGCQPSDV